MADNGDVPDSGLLASLRRLLATFIEIAQTRLEIVATEFEEERVRIRELVTFGFVALFFLSFGLMLLTLFIVALFWETHRLLVLGSFAAVYLVAGIGAALMLRKRLKSRPRLFATTVTELSKDRAHLTGE